MREFQKIKQKAVHSNGYVQTYTYTQQDTYTRGTGYSQRNSTWGYTWHSNSDGYNRWEDGSWRDNWGEDVDIYSRHYSEENRYSNADTYVNSNYKTLTNEVAYSIVNMSPTVSFGSATPTNGSFSGLSIAINLNGLTYSDTENNPATKYRIYYTYSSNNTSYGAYTLLSEQTSKTYSWSISDLPAGYYKIAVTAYDGESWSALLDSAKTGWTAHYIQQGAASTSGNTVTTVVDTSEYNTISYALSGVIQIIRYEPPTWLSVPYTKAAHDQLMEEIAEARNVAGLTPYVFTNASIVKDFTIITAQDVQQLQESANEAYNYFKQNDYNFSTTPTDASINKEIRKGAAILEIQDLLNRLAE